MRVIHWTLQNGSGLHRVAEDISRAEQALGVDSLTVDSTDPSKWNVDGDVHVVHSHLPIKTKGKIVWVGHGTPEHCFQLSVEAGLNHGYGASDSWMLIQYWMQHADALITFWPRHQWIWQSLADKRTQVHCVPMGVDKSFWQPVDSRGKYAGDPSLFTAENCHYIKWPLDLIIAWPSVSEHVPAARLHIGYLPRDQHRWWFPLVNRNGAAFTSYISENVMGKEDLRNAFVSCDYYVNLVRYGDFNRIGLEAKASGCKVISYANNPYADYWLTEGDQRKMAQELISILSGCEALPSQDVPDISQTAAEMVAIYRGLL